MNITKVRIKNFRGLEDIEFDPKAGINVLVGPNAVGKTSVLEAIRLTKAFLATRYRDELIQVLQSLGAASPHNVVFGEAQVDFSALAGVVSKPLEIRLTVKLSAQDLQSVQAAQHGIAQARVRQLIGQERAAQLDLIQYMSSQQGQAQFQLALGEVSTLLAKLANAPELLVGIETQVVGQNVTVKSTADPLGALILSALEGICPPAVALISYFPADRALPLGEVNIQIGSADMQQQVFGHLAQPAIKYGRLKQIIVNKFVLGDTSRKDLMQTFDAIFGTLLPGKKLESIQQKPTGVLSVLIRDLASGRVFDIDSMSSGEKGLILTFLLLKTGCAPRGLVLLDEPELHLNPAVCSRIVPFLEANLVNELQLQIILCTHSAEILSAALARDDCAIFHLRTSTDITPVDRKDKAELFEVLRRLGLNSMDVVSWSGTLFLEGEDDAELLSVGFPDVLANYQLKQLGGRGEVEKDIRRLQESEQRGELNRLSVFIFDEDSRRTTLQSSSLVRVAQWDRYCIENYLLDEGVLFDVLVRCASVKPASKGSLRNDLKTLAMTQLTDFVIHRAYKSREPTNCGIRPREVAGQSYENASRILFDRIEQLKGEIGALDRQDWTEMFKLECEQFEAELRRDWEDNWRKRCNGKRLFQDMQRSMKLNVAPAFLKSEVMKEMRLAQSDDWRLIESILRQVIAKP